jgi:predicted flavoprotein YhiN
LGSDAAWVSLLADRGVPIAPLAPSNCGFDIGWSAHFAQHHAGHPVKPVVLEWCGEDGQVIRQQGEFVVTATGVEGSLIYALSAQLRVPLPRTVPLGSTWISYPAVMHSGWRRTSPVRAAVVH